jgi:hypothetical protein
VRVFSIRAGAFDVERQQGRDLVAVIAQRLVGGVLDHRDVELGGQIENVVARLSGSVSPVGLAKSAEA